MIYCDMDGVLAKYNPEASVEDTHLPGYFLAREEEEKVAALLRRLQAAGRDVTILSAVYTTGSAASDKRAWLELHGLSNIPVLFVPYGEDKSQYVPDEPAVLLDDFSKNLHQWEANGNVGIKFYNSINGNHGTWCGFGISHRMSVDQMFVIVTAVADSIAA